MSMEKKIDGFTLKMIAVITMFIDHFAATVFERMLLDTTGSFPFVVQHANGLIIVYQILRGIGRLAFPIYCYLIVEGLYHTRSVGKYALRLGLFALLSELPFDLAFNRTLHRGWIQWGYNNVFFTLFVGLLTVACLRVVNQRLKPEKPVSDWKSFLQLFFRVCLNVCILFAGMAVAEFVFHSDYGAAGVAAIGAIYVFYNRPRLAFLSAVVVLAMLSSMFELVALVLIPVVGNYNGARGKQMKYFFYGFYPVHLLILEGICLLLGIG